MSNTYYIKGEIKKKWISRKYFILLILSISYFVCINITYNKILSLLDGNKLMYAYKIKEKNDYKKIDEINIIDINKPNSYFEKFVFQNGIHWKEHSENKIFTFMEKTRNKDFVYLYDESRKMSLKIKWNIRGRSRKLSPTIDFCYGQNCDDWSKLYDICQDLSRKDIVKGLRLCHESQKKLDEIDRNYVKNNPIPIHYIISTSNSDYIKWIGRYSYYWFKKYQPKTSNFTRLLTGTTVDEYSNEIPTFLAEPHNDPHDVYIAYNKPYSILQWLKAGNPVNEDIVGVLDADICIYKDISYLAVGVKEGSPVSSTSFMDFLNEDSPFDQLADQFCYKCEYLESIAVPIFIHKKDLLKVVERWYNISRRIRRYIIKNGQHGYLENKLLQLPWTTEMYGYIFGTSELELKHTSRGDIQEYLIADEKNNNKKIERTLYYPCIHFSMGMIMDDGYLWSKSKSNSSFYIPKPYKGNQVSSKLAAELIDARDYFESKDKILGMEIDDEVY